MILPLIARQAERGGRDVERYGAWATALRNLRKDWNEGIRVPPTSLATYLQAVPDDQRAQAMEDLIGEHLRLSWGAPPGPLLKDYGPQFSDGSAPAELLEEEFLARSLRPWGGLPPLEEYLNRFRNRADVIERFDRRRFAGDRFIRLRRLGKGASGEVWEVYDHESRRNVALKFARPGREQDPEIRLGFEREGRFTAQLDHPGIVRIHEIAPPDAPVPYLVFRLVRTPSLADLIRDFHAAGARSSRQQGWHSYLRFLPRVCDAVAHAHARGLLHRDLKPGNVLVGMDETVLIDWALAGPPGLLEASGTPEYMPPERLDAPGDVREDVYGLGAILYECLTGKPPCPWEGPRPADWSLRIRRDAFPAPRRLNSAVPRPLEQVCLRALSRDPSARPAGVGEFLRELYEALETACQASWGRKLWNWVSRPTA